MDDKDFRSLMGQFATGVTVVTTNNEGVLHGMTANAFSSLSLDPLLLLVCVVRGNTCHGELTKADRFGINILSSAQEDVSNTFAGRGEPEEGRLRGVPYRLGEHGVPLLDDTIAWVECRKADVLEGGDHDIFVGEALAGKLESEDDPLLFFRGGYRNLG